MKRLFILLALVLCMTSVFVACGDGEDTTSTTEQPSTTATTEDNTTPSKEEQGKPADTVLSTGEAQKPEDTVTTTSGTGKPADSVTSTSGATKPSDPTPDPEPEPEEPDESDIDPEPNVPDSTIEIAVNGVSEYVVVYDDSDIRVSDFAAKFVALMKDSYGITLESVPASQHTFSEYCIYVGNIKGVARVKAKLNSANDFGACVAGNDYVLYATNSRLYEYLYDMLVSQVLYTIRNGNWTTRPAKNFIYHESDYADVSYVDYVIEQNGGKLTQNLLYKFFEDRTFVAEDGTVLKYRLYVPYHYDENKEYPFVTYMHGAGERGNNNLYNMNHMLLELLKAEDSQFWDAIILSPQCPDGQQWVDTPWAEGGYRVEKVPVSNEIVAVMEIIDLVEQTFPTDLDRYYVMGLSMGGFATWDMIMRYPERFAAAVPICGGADYTQAYKLVDMPIYTLHDRNDGDVPCMGTKEMVVALEVLGSKVIFYEELRNYGHNVWGYASKKPEIWSWLFEQSRENR